MEQSRQTSRSYILPMVTLSMAAIIVFVLLCVSKVRGQGPQVAKGQKIAVLSDHPATLVRLDRTAVPVGVLTDKINRLMETAKVTGLCISILNNNRPVYTRAFGYANTTTHQQMDTSTEWWSCSFSKAVFAYFVMKQVDKGLIDLDTPLVHYLTQSLPDYKFIKKSRGYQDIRDDKRYEKITARMCLDHTTGFPNYRGFEPTGKLSIKYDPGTRYSYSGEGIYLLQFVIEQITGKKMEDQIKEEVLLPLGMTHSNYTWQAEYESDYCNGHDSLQHPYDFDRRNVSNAGGSLYTTIGDFSRFYTSLLNRQGLSAKQFGEMFHPQVPILAKKQFGPEALVDDRTEKTTKLFYGLGFGVIKTPYGDAFFKEGHSDGWGHYSIGFPDKGIAVIIMTNSDQGESIFKELLATTIGDRFTPWYWENYIPYDQKTRP